jgi:hypothetical protein
VHPYVVQSLAAERVREWQQEAELARRVKRARRARRGRAERTATLPAAHGPALPIPDQAPAPSRMRVSVPSQVPQGRPGWPTAEDREPEPYWTEPRQPAGARRA